MKQGEPYKKVRQTETGRETTFAYTSVIEELESKIEDLNMRQGWSLLFIKIC